MRKLVALFALGAVLCASQANACDGDKACKTAKGKKASACMTKAGACKDMKNGKCDMKAMKAGGKCDMKAMKSGKDCCKSKAETAPKS